MKRSRFFLVLFFFGVTAVSVVDAQDDPARYKSFEEKVIFGPNATDPALSYQAFMLKDVVNERDNLRLAKSVLVTDELGATDFHQVESLSNKIQAKKIFMLSGTDITSAEVIFFGSAKEVMVNGKRIVSEKLVSTGWTVAKIPTAFLQKGKNEIIFSGGGSLLVEPSKQPGHSWKSTDGGQSWRKEGLTGKGNQEGEYLVRLRLGKFAEKGFAISQVFDLWQRDSETLPTTSVLEKVNGIIGLKGMVQDGSSLTGFVRLGSTPIPDEKNWTDWIKVYFASPSGKPNIPFVPDKKEIPYRWGQLKLQFTTARGLISSHVFGSGAVSYSLGKEQFQGKTDYQVSFKPDTHFLLSSTPFVYQKPSPRLKLLRERYKLDQVIAPGKTELEQLMLLRYWVRNQWHTAWGNHPAQWMPAWDTLMILANKDQPDCLTMCTHYAAVYTQCCLALGWNARHCILDHHCVAEVYINDLGKWVMMDAGNSAQRADVGLHFEKDGVPMSARELHLAYHSKKTDGIQVRFTPHKLAEKIAHLCRPAPPAKEKYPPRPDVIPLADLKQYPVCQLENYRRYAFPARNNYLDSPLPGELYQGWSEYFYDGYYWVGDSPDNPQISPEYSLHLSPDRPQDADWQLNWTQVYLSRTEKQNQVRVDLGTFTPNFLTFERTVSLADGKTKTTQAPASSFTWELHAGKNRLTVLSINQWDKKGMPMEVEIVVKGP